MKGWDVLSKRRSVFPGNSSGGPESNTSSCPTSGRSGSRRFGPPVLEKIRDGFFDAGLWRLKGEAVRLGGRRRGSGSGPPSKSAGGRAARALELRAATRLGRLLGDAGKRKEALALFSGLSELLDGPESDPSLPDVRDALEVRTQLS